MKSRNLSKLMKNKYNLVQNACFDNAYFETDYDLYFPKYWDFDYKYPRLIKQ